MDPRRQFPAAGSGPNTFLKPLKRLVHGMDPMSLCHFRPNCCPDGRRKKTSPELKYIVTPYESKPGQLYCPLPPRTVRSTSEHSADPGSQKPIHLHLRPALLLSRARQPAFYGEACNMPRHDWAMGPGPLRSTKPPNSREEGVPTGAPHQRLRGAENAPFVRHYVSRSCACLVVA